MVNGHQTIVEWTFRRKSGNFFLNKQAKFRYNKIFAFYIFVRWKVPEQRLNLYCEKNAML